MSEKKYFSFWQIWILQILSFKSIYNLPYFIVRKIPPISDRKLESCMAQFGFPCVFFFFFFFFSCFLGFYDFRLYTGNVITHHIYSSLPVHITAVPRYTYHVSLYHYRQLSLHVENLSFGQLIPQFRKSDFIPWPVRGSLTPGQIRTSCLWTMMQDRAIRVQFIILTWLHHSWRLGLWPTERGASKTVA